MKKRFTHRELLRRANASIAFATFPFLQGSLSAQALYHVLGAFSTSFNPFKVGFVLKMKNVVGHEEAI